MPRLTDTADRILDVAEALLQERGFNGFAYKDISAALGIRNASIHFHFPTKSDLGVALARRYRERFMAELERIEEEEAGARRRLYRLRDLFGAVAARGNRMCLCGMLGAEMPTLPGEVAAEASRFFVQTAAWIARVLRDGRAAGELPADGAADDADDQAASILALLEGAMVVVRGLGAPQRYNALVTGTLDQITRPAA